MLVVDLQNHEISEEEQRKYPEYVDRVKHQIVPNVQRLLQAARSCGVEVMYTVIESLTKDGRDRSLCHRKLVIPKGSWGAQVIPEIAPGEDDIVLPKTASGVFSSTILERVLRNMGIEEVIVVGVLTDQCIDMALRDGVDRSFHMICVTDCCAAYTEETQLLSSYAIWRCPESDDGGDCIGTLRQVIRPKQLRFPFLRFPQ